MPVFVVNGSPNALAAAFCQSPPNTKAVTGDGAASALANAPNSPDSAEPPNTPTERTDEIPATEAARFIQRRAQAGARLVHVDAPR